MMFRPVLRQRPWYDTPVANSYGMKGLATILVGRSIAYVGWKEPANDRDFWQW